MVVGAAAGGGGRGHARLGEDTAAADAAEGTAVHEVHVPSRVQRQQLLDPALHDPGADDQQGLCWRWV